MKKTTLFLLFFYTILNAQTSDWGWVKSFPDINVAINDSFMDNQKNIYQIGVFKSETLTIGGTVITNSSDVSPITNAKFPDTYITKHDSNGNLLYVKHFSGSKIEGLTSITYDNNNHFYVTGHYNGSITLGTNVLQSQNDETKSFLAKLDLDGNVVWSKAMNYHGAPILKFKDNNLYLTGTHTSNTYTIDNLTTPSVGYTAVIDFMDKTFIAKLDTSGNAIWLKSSTYNGSAAINEPHRVGTQPKAMTVDNLGNVYIAGMIFCRSTTFGSITLNKSVSNNNANLFIVKYDSNGTVAWASSAPTNSAAHTTVTDIVSDSSNNIFLCGQVYNSLITFGGTTLNFNTGQGSYLTKYAPAGNVLWAKAAKIATDAQPSTGIGMSSFERLFVDGNNNIYATGLFIKYVNFGNNLVYENTTNTGIGNLFSIKYDSSGNPGDFYKITEANNTLETKILDISENENVYYYHGKTSTNSLVLGDFTIANPDYLQLTYFGKRDKRLSTEEHFVNNFTLYPNPSQEQIYISGMDSLSENMLFTIYDISGKKIKSLESANEDVMTIDIKDLASGSYVLKIQGAATKKSIQFVKN
ncbi:T9SS type A sorting domain-containing protein [Flavobacterium microcysteis]